VSIRTRIQSVNTHFMISTGILSDRLSLSVEAA
jgi:hypothetical protein